MSGKTVLVLGASLYQVPIVETARRLNYRVIITDNVPSNPGHALADRSYGVDTTDWAAVLELARREAVSGVLAPATDVAVPTACYVAEQLGLPGAPLESARIMCNKAVFRRFLGKQGFPVAAGLTLSPEQDLDPGLLDGRRWVVKPDRSSGSKGVFILTSARQLSEYLPEARAFSPGGVVVLEEFLDGCQGTCEGFLREGAFSFQCTSDRQTVPPPHTATSGHRLPSSLDSTQGENLRQTLEGLFEALGVREGPVDCDFVARGDDIFVLELSPRVGGNCLPALIQESFGFDYLERCLKHACGEAVEFPASPTAQPTAVVLLGAEADGILRYDQKELPRLRAEPWVASLRLDYAPGTRVRRFINGRHRIGEAILRGHSRADLDRNARALLQRLAIATD